MSKSSVKVQGHTVEFTHWKIFSAMHSCHKARQIQSAKSRS